MRINEKNINFFYKYISKTYIFSYPLTDKSTPDFNLLDLAELK